jgi:hypothetical protein
MTAEEFYQKKLNEKMNDVQIAAAKRHPNLNSGFCGQCKDNL